MVVAGGDRSCLERVAVAVDTQVHDVQGDAHLVRLVTNGRVVAVAELPRRTRTPALDAAGVTHRTRVVATGGDLGCLERVAVAVDTQVHDVQGDAHLVRLVTNGRVVAVAELPRGTLTPALDAASGTYRTRVVVAGGDQSCLERVAVVVDTQVHDVQGDAHLVRLVTNVVGRVAGAELPSGTPTPALDAAGGTHRARVEAAGGDLGRLERVAVAVDTQVHGIQGDAHLARLGANAQLVAVAELPIGTHTPALDVAGGVHRTGVVVACGDRSCLERVAVAVDTQVHDVQGDAHLVRFVADVGRVAVAVAETSKTTLTPALDATGGTHRTRVVATGGDLGRLERVAVAVDTQVHGIQGDAHLVRFVADVGRVAGAEPPKGTTTPALDAAGTRRTRVVVAGGDRADDAGAGVGLGRVVAVCADDLDFGDADRRPAVAVGHPRHDRRTVTGRRVHAGDFRRGGHRHVRFENVAECRGRFLVGLAATRRREQRQNGHWSNQPSLSMPPEAHRATVAVEHLDRQVVTCGGRSGAGWISSRRPPRRTTSTGRQRWGRRRWKGPPSR